MIDIFLDQVGFYYITTLIASLIEEIRSTEFHNRSYFLQITFKEFHLIQSIKKFYTTTTTKILNH